MSLLLKPPFRKEGDVIYPRVTGDVLSCTINQSYGVSWDESADTYVRTGALTGVACGSSPGNSLLPIQASMRRCILNDSGVVQYYLDPASSYNRIGQAPSMSGTDDAGAASKVSEAVVATGTDDGTGVAYKLTDTGVFTAAESAYVGKYVHNTTDGTYAKVTAKDSDNVLSIDTNIMANGEVFNVGTLCGVAADYVGHYVHDKTGDVYAMITAKDSDAALSIDANIMANLDEYEICTAVLNGTDGQVMLEIPLFYHRYAYSTTTHTYEISQTPLTGFSVHPEFVVDGVVKPYVYVGAYEACLYDNSASIYANGIRLEAGNVTFVAEAGDDSIERTVETNGFTNLEIGDKIVISGATDGGNNATFTVSGIVSDKKITVSEAVVGRVDDAAVVITSEMDFVNDKLSSVSGKTPAVYATRDNFRVVAVKRGTGWSQQDFDNVSAVQLLYLVEYADFFSQSMIGNGCTDWTGGTWDTYNDYNPINKTGLSNSLGNATGNVSNLDGNTGSYMSYRGIENFYGHLWKRVDGINVNDHVPYVCSNPADFADGTANNYTDIGVTLINTHGYQNTLVQQDRGFLPASVGAGSTTKITDYYYQATGWQVAMLGGHAHYSVQAGAFDWSLGISAGDRARNVSARLQKK